VGRLGRQLFDEKSVPSEKSLATTMVGDVWHGQQLKCLWLYYCPFCLIVQQTRNRKNRNATTKHYD